MKEKFSALALIALSVVRVSAADGNMIGQMTQNEGLIAVPAPKEVKIDGDLGEWDLSGQIWSFADYETRDQYSVKSAAMWDKDNLYLSFLWKDPMPMNSTVDPDVNPELGWRADAVECRIKAGEKPMWLTCWWYKDRPCALRCYWTSPTSDKNTENKLYKGTPGSAELGDGMESFYKLLPTKDGFVHELKIPWAVLTRGNGLPRLRGAKPRHDVVGMFQLGLEFKWGGVNGFDWPMHRFTDNMSKGNTSREFYWRKVEAWGDVTLSDTRVKEPRTYVYKVARPEGTIPVRAEIPADAKTFTLVIENKDGKRIRNLAGGFDVAAYRVNDKPVGRTVPVSRGSAGTPRPTTVEVMWDGLDDFGRLVPPGEYRVRGLTHKGLTPKFVMCLYNPGTPAWGTPDGKGGWGADHARVKCVAQSGDGIMLSSGFVEGGSGVWRMGADGKKAWSDIRGVQCMTANDTYVFTVPTHWYTKEESIYRYDAKTGQCVPFMLNGKARPNELPIREIAGVAELKNLNPVKDLGGIKPADLVAREKSTNPKVMALAAGPETFLIALADGLVIEANQETGEKVAEYKLDYDWTRLAEDTVFAPLAFDGKTIYYYHKGVLRAFGLPRRAAAHNDAAGRGVVRDIATSVPVEQPSAITLGADGSIYIADCGADMQVKRFRLPRRAAARNDEVLKAELIQTYGRKGGRARTGVFDKEAMRMMSGVAVDARGNVWVVEFSDFPRRVSVWQPDGTLRRDYIGNTGYAGVGVVLHDTDPARAFVGPNEISFDEKAHTYEMKNVLVNPAPGELTVGMNVCDNNSGHVFRSSASGKTREYFFRNQRLYMKGDTGAWRAVACILEVGKLQGLFLDRHDNVVVRHPHGEFEGLNPYDLVFWCDANKDGLIQRAECDILASNFPYELNRKYWKRPRYMTGWGQRLDPGDMAMYLTERTASKRLKASPESFTDDGVPKWTAQAIQVISRLPECGTRDMVPVPGEDTLVTFARLGKKDFLMGLTKDGREKWAYPDPYNCVHGSHAAPMPRPGMLIGSLKILGFLKDCGDAENVFLIRGNLGQDFYVTTDGLFVDQMFRDCRLPSQVPPKNEAELRAMPFNLFSMGGEPFNGSIAKHADGVVRMVCGAPAREAASLVRIDGLDTIRRFTGGTFTVGAVDLAKADAANIARAGENKAKPYTVERAAGAVDWSKVKPMRLEIDGQVAKGVCRLVYDDANLRARFEIANDASPWVNGGKDKTRMFKTGDCVDLCLSPTANAKNDAAEGDLRVVVSPFGGRAVAMLMRKVWSKAARGEQVRYQSPVRAFEMAQVKELAAPTVTTKGATTIVELALPWAELGVSPKSGLKLRGDAGMILSDPTGTFNTARVYHSNKNTNLVNDLPGEADLYPSRWTDFILK